ncbi:MAG: 16S rRNA (cytosine(1402)-N(4))-methyltransferase RsmH [Gammaproteobacteria bacterium]|nr:16S rRNA (cytosine(1402)-N(4))-methyltransferase RsmH [Gammaproteobacteria bacterium]
MLLAEVIENLAITPQGVYVDATFGRGGHTIEIIKRLNQSGKILIIDKDPEAIKAAEELADARIIIRKGTFAQLFNWVDELGLKNKINGILLDLGVSSPQLDTAERGFSFLHDGPLDMRMDTTQKLSAATWINHAPEAEIATVLKEYGEEKFSRRIARAIVAARKVAPILTTAKLAEIVSNANPRWEKTKHPATRTFQALRIFVNNELAELKACLEQCLEILAVGGRLLVITFHSLEDRIVKEFMRKAMRGGDFPDDLPVLHEKLQIRIKQIGRAIRASNEELKQNQRARSATLRVMEKIK